MFRSCRDAPAKSIAGVKEEGRFCSDKCRPGDGRQELAVSQDDLAFENAPNHALLPPDLAGSQETFGIQAGQLGAGTGAAGGPVVLLARAEYEIAAIHGWRCAWAMKFDVIDFGALRTANTGAGERLPDSPSEMDELVEVRFRNGVGMMFDQKKPVAAPGNVTGHCTESRDFDVDSSGPAVAGYVFEGHGAVFVQRDSDDAYRRLYAVSTGLDSAQICKRGYNADGPVTAHAQASAVVEENDARNAVRTSGLAEQCAHHRLGSTGFGDKGPAEGFVILLKQKTTLPQVPVPKVRATFDDGASRLAAGVRIDNTDLFQKILLCSVYANCKRASRVKKESP